ncbi:MAG TPA: GNAT family protein [Cellulomonas sp.]
MGGGWPAVLTDGDVRLRPLRRRDGPAWMALRTANVEWLAPWEASSPAPLVGPAPTFGAFVRSLSAQGRQGVALSFAVEYRGELAGQLTVSSIAYGSLRSAAIGYWVSRHVAGRGVMPIAVALATDHCFDALGLHRVEINIRTENRASLRVVDKLGFRDEGVRRRYLHIAGTWRDHRTFALTTEDVPEGLLVRWRAAAVRPPE